MYSVIIPTMWKFKPFYSFLETLLHYDLVGEVILFNNNEKEAPILSSHKKLKIINRHTNLGVNPCWNEGANLAQYNNLCILNDDVVFDLTLFNKLEPYLFDLNNGVFGLCPGEKDFNQPPFVDGEINISPWTGEHSYGYGCLFFINKKNWIDIPQELFIYFGDNWIFDTCLANRKTNYVFTNIVHYTPFAATVSETGKGFLDAELPIFNERFKNEKWALEIFNNEANIAKGEFSDIQAHLPVLEKYGLRSESVIELGVRTGLSTRIWLNCNLKKFTAIDIEEHWPVRDLFNVADIVKRNWYYVICNSLDYEDPSSYDTIFIDTDHTYEQLEKELYRYHTQIKKYIILHDVFTYGIKKDKKEDPGLLPAVLEFLSDNPQWHVVEYDSSSNGLVVLERI